MTDTLTRPVADSTRPPWLPLLVIAVLLAVSAGGVAWWLLQEDGASHIEIVEQITADYDFVDDDEVPFSYADVDRFLENFAADATILGGSVSDPEVREVLAAFDIWDEQVEIVSGPWELDADQVRAELRHTDAFHGAGGLVMTASHTYRFNSDDEVVLEYLRTPDYGDYKTFEEAFIAWYEEVAYPGETLEREDGGLRWNAENAAISAATVDNFLAYSDEYPVSR
ncbi:MAG: hypothetical protein HKN80_13355 [Acidimicrobiia bacterium]|nr:hypothetical protein [Acidimicrobiia bacterium]